MHRKAQWRSDANYFYSHSSSFPISEFGTSIDLPLLLPLPLSFIPLLIWPNQLPLSFLSCFLSPIPSPIAPRAFTCSCFHPLLPAALPLPLRLPAHQSTSVSVEFPVATMHMRWEKGGREPVGGECKWLRSLPLNRQSRGSCADNVARVGSAFKDLDRL